MIPAGSPAQQFHTCLETMFLRVSQFLEKSLDSSPRHQDLLGRGRAQPRVSDQSYVALSELPAFRHFERYCVEFAYDSDRLSLVQK